MKNPELFSSSFWTNWLARFSIEDITKSIGSNFHSSALGLSNEL